MLAIRRLLHHSGPARWLMERIGSCNPGAVAWGFLPLSGTFQHLLLLRKVKPNKINEMKQNNFS